MKTFNKKTLCAALAGLGVLGLAGAAQAVNLNPDGLGQVLIYPYYTVRADADGNAFNSMISVVNTSDQGKAVKVRFLEGKASHEVLDFNLYMSAFDVWTGYVIPTADGAALGTKDNSCTYGNVAAAQPVPFKNDLFAGALADGEDATLDRTREGYVEIIAMADIPSVAANATYTAIKHDKNGVPADCTAVIDNGDQSTTPPAWAKTDLTSPTGGLFGNMTLINVNTARAAGFDAVALTNFYDGTTEDWAGNAAVTANTTAALAVKVDGTLWFPSGNMNPNLSMAWPTDSYLIRSSATSTAGVVANTFPGIGGDADGWKHELINGKVVRSVFTPGLDATSSTMMRSAIYNEYMNSDMVAGATDWVITMPTKGLYFDRGAAGGAAANTLIPRALFQNVFKAGGSADAVGAAYFNREEASITPTMGNGFSPVIPGVTAGSYLRWEANVVNFGSNTRTVFGSTNWNNIATDFDAGWAQLSIAAVATGTGAATPAGTAHTIQGSANLFTGLPVIGFATELYNNATVSSAGYGTVWASYAATVPHRFDRSIQ